MGTALESKVRIQREDFSVTDEIEFMKKSSRNIGGITIFLGTGRESNKGESGCRNARVPFAPRRWPS